MAVENVFIPFFLCPELAQRELNGSLYRLLAEYGLRIARPAGYHVRLFPAAI